MATVTVISPVTGKPVEHKRVAAYCRVSTNSADQQNSYNTQVRYYTRYIKSRTEWTLVDIFADEGLSGTSSEKRENFQRMITMCELKQIDLVVTKSVSRFARNVKETLEYVQARPLEHPRQEKHRVALCQPLGPRHTILQGISHSQRRQAQGSRRPCNPTIQ